MARAGRFFLPFLVVFVAGSGFASHARTLTFEQRVKAQEAIERVYYSHQIAATEPFDEAVPNDLLERKVRTYLKQSVALEKLWNAPLTAGMLEREVERMAAGSRMPERLAELFAALGNDRFVIEECLARPHLVDRLARDYFQQDVEAQDAAGTRAWDRWWSDVAPTLDEREAVEVAPTRGTLPALRTGGGSAETFSCAPRWDNGSLGEFVAGRSRHTAVWTGSVVIVWGGLLAGGTETASGARYDPALDTWSSMTQEGAPSARQLHTAVWTGTRMLVYGGGAQSTALNTGGRYDPATDTWTAMSGGPGSRGLHTAVWTGSRMIVWGGTSSLAFLGSAYGDGGIYDPEADSWIYLSGNGAPQGRFGHSAVWTGNRMIVWGGAIPASHFPDPLASGGVFDPATLQWTPTSMTGAPAARSGHNAFWTGNRMLVFSPDTAGGRYDPATDSWAPMSTVGAPAGRTHYSAVWTGSRMLIWGGHVSSGWTSSGAGYDPVSDAWAPISSTLAPAQRELHSAVWTGSKMVVWGGTNQTSGGLDTGGRYDPVTNSWSFTATKSGHAPGGRKGHTAVWTGSQMIVWGGDKDLPPISFGSLYDPATDDWKSVSSTNEPAPRTRHAAVWTGSRMILWGGGDSSGGRYDPISDTWTPTSLVGAPSSRESHVAVWTGSRMVIWGGSSGGSDLDTGGRYDPVLDAWQATSTIGAPIGGPAAAVWTGDRMVVWRGPGVGDGGRYDPVADTWAPVSTAGAPNTGSSAVWTGSLMIVWGGSPTDNTGGRYNPVADAWTPVSTVNAPSPRTDQTAVWTGRSMIVWGGQGAGSTFTSAGGQYDVISDTWVATPATGSPSARAQHTAVWTGDLMIVWAGKNSSQSPAFPETGGRYSVGIAPDNDHDGFTECTGDCNDANGAAHPFAVEACNGIDDDCNGLTDEDRAGVVDPDGDQVPNACNDNCAASFNPSQTDTDHDGEGDVCDVNDGLIWEFRVDKSSASWQAEQGPTSWNIYFGDLAVLKSTGVYTQVPGSNPLAARDCGLAITFAGDPTSPGVGEVSFSLVTGVVGGVEGSLGTSSTGTRPNANPCP